MGLHGWNGHPRVLVVEDDAALSDVVCTFLSGEGYDCVPAFSGTEALLLAERAGEKGEKSRPFDLVILDLMLPGLPGEELMGRLRAVGVAAPVIVTSAKSAVTDRVGLLRLGACDYLVKPFDLDELLARLRALHRRASYDEQEVVTVGDLVVDGGARRVTRAGTEIDLSAREFDILWLLAARVGKVVSRFTILDEVWDGETDLRSNVIDVHLGAIGAKVDRPFGTASIVTVRGAGYRLEPS